MIKFPSCRRVSLPRNKTWSKTFSMERWTELVTTLLCFTCILFRSLSTPHSEMAWRTKKFEHTTCFAEMQSFFQWNIICTYLKREVGASANEWLKGWRKNMFYFYHFNDFENVGSSKPAQRVVINDLTSFYRTFRLEAKFYLIMASNYEQSSSFCDGK